MNGSKIPVFEPPVCVRTRTGRQIPDELMAGKWLRVEGFGQEVAVGVVEEGEARLAGGGKALAVGVGLADEAVKGVMDEDGAAFPGAAVGCALRQPTGK